MEMGLQPMAETRRQRIVEILHSGPHTALELAREIGAPVKFIVSDLEHVLRSLRGRERVITEPAECASCGFVFRSRTRVETPSRCPECRSEEIEEPRFGIEGPPEETRHLDPRSHHPAHRRDEDPPHE